MSGATKFLRAGIPTLLIAIAVGRGGRVSVQAWLAAAAVWVVGTLLWDFIARVSVEDDRRTGVWQLSRVGRRRRIAPGPHGMRTLSLLVADARSNPRVYAKALRPRLVRLAEHYFAIRHGFDLDQDPTRGAALLGEVAWLLDPEIRDRTPSNAELDSFLSIVLDEPHVPGSNRRYELPAVTG